MMPNACASGSSPHGVLASSSPSINDFGVE
jgi:hypothetical protein